MGVLCVSTETQAQAKPMSTARKEPQSEAERMAVFLDLPQWRKVDDLALVETVNRGFPAKTAKVLVSKVDPTGRMLHVSDIIPQSSYYRRLKKRQVLTKAQSERIFDLAKVTLEVLRHYHGDTTRSAHFLLREHPMLGGRSPLALAKESTAGSDLVLKLLAKAEAGVAA
jgi:putative toxin-antitoxin system antitoxin component (TIGR02293 family)